MLEEKPEQLPVSPQETQIQAPSLWEKIQAQKKKILIGLGSFLGVLILVGAVFGVYKYAQNQIPLEPVGEPTPEVATPTPDPTVDWKTHTNTKYGYSIKYPREVEIDEGKTEAVFQLLGPHVQIPGEFIDGFGITIKLFDNKDNRTPREIAEDTYRQSQEEIQEVGGNINECKVENISRGVDGARFTYCLDAPGKGILGFSEWFIYEENTIEIYVVLQNKSYEDTLNLILSTFRFD